MRAALAVAAGGRAAGDRRRRRRARLGRAARAGRARRGAADPGRDLAQRQGLHSRRRTRSRSACAAPIRARARTASSTAADLVCFIGTETGGMTTHFWAVPKIGTPAIQIDIDPEALGRNYPLRPRCCGDAKVTLARCSSTPTRRPRRSASLDRRGAGASVASGTRNTSPLLTSDAGADPSGAHVRRAHPARAGRRAS